MQTISKEEPATMPLKADEQVNKLIEKAQSVFDDYRTMDTKKRTVFLETIADELTKTGPSFIAVTSQETSLPQPRLQNEMQRTINQIKMFANLVKEGSWVNAIIDTAQPERLPLPKPDTRQMQIPIGVVGVFGASNFPYAFSVAGGDTIAALAAGCPVVYKTHSGHPLTSRLVTELMQRVARETGMPDGIFSMVEGSGQTTGIALVQHPHVKAIGFTGSLSGGKALLDAASRREEPIPVYAEMGSVNPVFILPEMLAKNGATVADSLAASNTLSMGQFCTKPGVIIFVDSEGTGLFFREFAAAIIELPGTKMLTARIHSAYKKGLLAFEQNNKVKVFAKGKEGIVADAAVSFAVKISGAGFLANKEFYEELFGPFSIHVLAENTQQLLEIARSFKGQLTCSVWGTESDCEKHIDLFAALEKNAGRILLNNVPTGVEVTHAMVHGGPFPATSNEKFTSVGSRSIYRFTRPVCYQNFSDKLLPEALKNSNPLQIIRYVNGDYSRGKIPQKD